MGIGSSSAHGPARVAQQRERCPGPAGRAGEAKRAGRDRPKGGGEVTPTQRMLHCNGRDVAARQGLSGLTGKISEAGSRQRDDRAALYSRAVTSLPCPTEGAAHVALYPCPLSAAKSRCSARSRHPDRLSARTHADRQRPQHGADRIGGVLIAVIPQRRPAVAHHAGSWPIATANPAAR